MELFALFERLSPLMTIISHFPTLVEGQPLAAHIGGLLGERLRSAYAELLHEPLPEAIVRLIQELDELDSTMGAAEETSEEMLSEA